MGENGTPEARSADTIGIIAGAVTGSDPAVTPDIRWLSELAMQAGHGRSDG